MKGQAWMKSAIASVSMMAAVFSIQLAGCGTGNKAQIASSPSEAAKLFVKSIETGDKRQFDAVVEVKPHDKELAYAYFELLLAVLELKSEFVKAYGVEAVEKLECWFFRIPPLEDQDFKVEATGDKAAHVNEDCDLWRIPLVKVNGAWKLTLNEQWAPTEDDKERASRIAAVKERFKATNAAKARVGQPNVTPVEILAEVDDCHWQQ